MGVVYEAHDPLLGRRLAVKSILVGRSFAEAERAAFEQRFLTEARIAAQLQHPGIVVVHDIGRDAETGGLYIALEYLEGRTLDQVISSGTSLPWQETLRIAARVAEALHHAHEHGVVHRDVKPANVMLLASGEPKIMDFGIARLDASRMTLPGAVFGTPLYMSPEQAQGQPVDPRSDLFSLGTITYALLTGASPFEAANVPAILARVASLDPPPPSTVVKGLPPEVDVLVARAMARDPESRYPTGQMLAEDFDDVRSGRPPRHAADWKPSNRGAATVVSPPSVPIARTGHVANARLRDVEEQLTAPPRSKPSPTRRRTALLALLVVVAAASWVLTLQPDIPALWLSLLEGRSLPVVGGPSPEPAPTPPFQRSPEASEGAAVALTPSLAQEPTPGEDRSAADAGSSDSESEPEEEIVVGDTEGAQASVPVGGSAATASDVSPQSQEGPPSGTSPRAAVSPTPRPTPKRSAPPTLSAVLQLELLHNVKSGLVDVWLDEEPVMTRRIHGRLVKKVLFYERYEGRFATRFRMKPGRHSVGVRVRWDDDSASAGVRATFPADKIRRLRARLDGGKLTLYW
jgi:hypothetical protein